MTFRKVYFDDAGGLRNILTKRHNSASRPVAFEVARLLLGQGGHFWSIPLQLLRVSPRVTAPPTHFELLENCDMNHQ